VRGSSPGFAICPTQASARPFWPWTIRPSPCHARPAWLTWPTRWGRSRRQPPEPQQNAARSHGVPARH